MGLTPFLHSCFPSTGFAAQSSSVHAEHRPDSTHALDPDCVACNLANQARTDLAADAVVTASLEPVRDVAADPRPTSASFTHRVLYARPPPFDV
jgi:hypothetical protein